MAKKKSSAESKTVLERTYTIPLGRELLKVPANRKAKKAMTAIREFMAKHMKATDVRLQRALNDAVWTNGIRNPLKKVKVTATKDDKGVVKVNLFGAKEEPKKESAPKKKTAPAAPSPGAAPVQEGGLKEESAEKPFSPDGKDTASADEKGAPPADEKPAEKPASHQKPEQEQKAAAQEKEELKEQQQEQKKGSDKPAKQPTEQKEQQEQKQTAPDHR